jgi:glucose/arabinose dehydrogenase
VVRRAPVAPRARLVRARRWRRTGTFVALSVAAGSCGGASPPTAEAPLGKLLERGEPAAALAALPGGDLLAGYLRSGEIRRIGADGRSRRAFPRLPVSTAGQRGLLSLATVGDEVYAAWTTPARRLVVGRLRRQERPVLVWRGVTTTTLANGGHLAVAPGGRLVIGIGDRQAGRPVGRLLSLDPRGPADQRPRVLSVGWNNPFAFAFTPDGRLWVADNAPGRRPERLARGDTGGPPADVTTLGRRPAASGLAALGPRALALCGVLSGTLDRYELGDDRRWSYARTLARGCRYGVVRLGDGRLAFGADDAIRTVRP